MVMKLKLINIEKVKENIEYHKVSYLAKLWIVPWNFCFNFMHFPSVENHKIINWKPLIYPIAHVTQSTLIYAGKIHITDFNIKVIMDNKSIFLGILKLDIYFLRSFYCYSKEYILKTRGFIWGWNWFYSC